MKLLQNNKLIVEHGLLFNYRSSHPEVFCKKSVLKNFEKFTGKHMCQSLFLNKLAGYFYTSWKHQKWSATLFKKRLWQRRLRELCEIFKNTFFHRTPPLAVSLTSNLGFSWRKLRHSILYLRKLISVASISLGFDTRIFYQIQCRILCCLNPQIIGF